jgi:hypothetical protein
MKDKKLDIVKFAKKELKLHLFDYEEKHLRDYEESMAWSSYDEWVKPPQEKQRTYQIWLQYQEYLKQWEAK